jgi:hypothetical protein
MANSQQLAIIEQGIEVWSEWRKDNAGTKIDLFSANLSGTFLN